MEVSDQLVTPSECSMPALKIEFQALWEEAISSRNSLKFRTINFELEATLILLDLGLPISYKFAPILSKLEFKEKEKSRQDAKTQSQSRKAKDKFFSSLRLSALA